MSENAAGFLFALGSAIGLVSRLVLGHDADRRPGRLLTTVAVLFTASVVGFCLLAIQRPIAVVIGTVALCATSWGWGGLYFLAVVRSCPRAPATASGVAATGVLIGAVLGPLAFGLLASQNYSIAWIAAAASTLAAGGVVLIARWSIRRDVLGPAPTHTAPHRS